MLSKTPYLIEATRNWAMDAGLTPHLLIDNLDYPGLNIPAQIKEQHRKHGNITFNVHARAVEGFEMSNDYIHFNARFSGKMHQVDIPMEAVKMVFTAETKEGITFHREVLNIVINKSNKKNEDSPPVAPPSKPKSSKSGKPHLKLVK